MRLVFFGTPEFAVPSLQALLAERVPPAAVVTQPDRPRGRSRSVLVAPPVKDVALAAGLPLLQPERPVGDLFLAALRRLEPDLGVVVAYGHLLRPEVLAVPRLGMINVHASLLPRYRGAAPIEHAILHGEPETGVSIMQMEAGLDTGPVLHRLTMPVETDETAGTLRQRLAMLGATALLEGLSLIAGGLVRPVPQDETLVTYAPKIGRDTARIDWRRDAAAIARQVRAFDPAPGAWASLEGAAVKLFGARPAGESAIAEPAVSKSATGESVTESVAVGGSTAAADAGTANSAGGTAEPGTVLRIGEQLLVASGRGAVAIREIQPEGRTRLPVAAWVRGRGVTVGQRFE